MKNKKEILQKRIRTETIAGEVCGKIATYLTMGMVVFMFAGYALNLKADGDEKKLRKLNFKNK